jgi:hypothetical protein
MDVSLGWYDFERTILYLRLAGYWDEEISRRVIREFHERMRAVSCPVDLIAYAVDRPAAHPPVWVAQLGIRGILSTPQNFGHLVLVPESAMLLALADVGTLLLGERYAGKIHTAPTLEAASGLLRKARQP